jgi:hypothetical protein
MPRNIIGGSPFPVRTIELDRPLTLDDISLQLRDIPGVSLCVRTAGGHTNRGGYFFHIAKDGADYRIFDISKRIVATLTPQKLVRFVNHVSGRQFDAEMLVFCQSVVNFKQDQNEHG